MSSSPLTSLLAVARGDLPADLLLRGARLLNVFSGEIHPVEIAVAGDRIAAVHPPSGAPTSARRVRDLEGRFVAPGLIDAHVHIESSLTVPSAFAHAVLPRGVTTVITDPHEIANVAGLEGIRWMLRDGAAAELEIFVNASSCVPASPLATAGAALDAAALAGLLDEPRVLGLAEVMNFPGVVQGDPDILAKLAAFAGRVLDGHCPGLSGAALNAYIASGISSDHESVGLDEAREKLRLGLVLFLREATNARNLDALLPLVTPANAHRVCFCTDDRVPRDLLDEGSIDHMVRRAIAFGLDPVLAWRLGSLNAADHYGLRDRGAVAPGRRADLVVFRDLDAPRADEVYLGGNLVAEGGAGRTPRRPPVDGAPRRTVHLDPAALEAKPTGAAAIDLAIPAPGDDGPRTARVIGLVPDQLVTESLTLEIPIRQGRAVADPSRDLLKIVVIERHGITNPPNIGRGFVRGVGLRRGAIAGTQAHDHHNLLAVGADDHSMRTALRAVIEDSGGFAVAEGDNVLARLPLPIAGLMSDQSIEDVRRVMDDLLAAARELGSTLHDPFMAMSFLGLEVIPSLKITDRGLVDVERFEIAKLFPPELEV